MLNGSLLLANDSVLFPITNTDRFWRSFWAAKTDLVGVTSNFCPSYHIQGYFVYAKPRAVSSKAFKDFWRFHRPINSTRHAVLKGELGFSAAMLNAGFSARSIFSISIFC